MATEFNQTTGAPLNLPQWTGERFNFDDVNLILQNVNTFAEETQQSVDSLKENSWNKTNLPIESGIWTPVLKGATTTGNPTYSSRSGSYERQGNLILVNFSLVITNKGGMAGSVAVDGLPFTSRGFFASTVGDGGGVNLPSGTVFSHMIVVNNTLNLVCKNNNGYVALDASQISDNFHFYHGTAFYRI